MTEQIHPSLSLPVRPLLLGVDGDVQGAEEDRRLFFRWVEFASLWVVVDGLWRRCIRPCTCGGIAA